MSWTHQSHTALPFFSFFALQSPGGGDGHRYTFTPTSDTEETKSKKKKKEDDLEDLKQELEMDEHRIPIEELYDRLGVDPTKVSVSFRQTYYYNV